MPEPVTVYIGSPRSTSSVRIGDVDVTDLVTKVAITAGVRSLPSVTLDLKAQLVYFVADAANVVLPAELVSVLEQLGWSPPGPRLFTPEDVETMAEALWVYWHRGSRWETEGWTAQSAYEQQAYRDKARYALRALGTLADDTFVTAKLGDVVSVPQSVIEPTSADPTAWRYGPDSTPRSTDGV